MFLYENFFFKRINKTVFCKKYFNEFIHKEFLQGDHLFTENEAVDYLYFIKEGEVRLYCNKNLFQITKMTHDLIGLIKNPDKFSFQQEYDLYNSPAILKDKLKVKINQQVKNML